MDDKTFYNEIYMPYNEAWKIIKQIKDGSATGPGCEKVWLKFVEDTDRFTKKYDTDAGHAIARMLTDMGDIIAKING